MSDDPLNNPLSELGHISLTARQLSYCSPWDNSRLAPDK